MKTIDRILHRFGYHKLTPTQWNDLRLAVTKRHMEEHAQLYADYAEYLKQPVASRANDVPGGSNS